MRQEKQLLLNEIKGKIDGAKAFFIARYQSIDPNKASAFRIDLCKTDSELEVVRKRIFLKAAQAAGISLDEKMLDGHIGVVFANADPVQTTKAIYDFSKENEGMLTVIGGLFEGQMCSAKDIEAISKLPSKDEMRSQLLSVFEAPMANALSVVEGLLTSVMHCLENKSKEEQNV